MTKYVMHGGFDKNISYIKDEFFQKALDDTPEDVKIFLVFFAECDEYLELRIKQCKDQFENNRGSKNLKFKIATEDNFLRGCAWANIIFLSGGRTAKLMGKLEQFGTLKRVFDNKTVVGDSAGVNVLSQLFYSRKSKETHIGLGILPFNVIVHYTEDMGNPLADIDPDFETIFLHEYETREYKY